MKHFHSTLLLSILLSISFLSYGMEAAIVSQENKFPKLEQEAFQELQRISNLDSPLSLGEIQSLRDLIPANADHLAGVVSLICAYQANPKDPFTPSELEKALSPSEDEATPEEATLEKELIKKVGDAFLQNPTLAELQKLQAQVSKQFTVTTEGELFFILGKTIKAKIKSLTPNDEPKTTQAEQPSSTLGALGKLFSSLWG